MMFLALAAVAAHVVVIGVDGMSPAGIRNSQTPNMAALIKSGAHTFHARGVMPTSSSPNWASMIMGAGPEQHGITSNDWEPDKFDIAPVVAGPGGIFPTIFGVLRQQRPKAVIAVFYDWKGYGRLVERGVPDILENGDGPQDTIARAARAVRERKPALTFIQLDHVDHNGHKFGHGSPEYHAAIAEADRLIGEMIAAIKDAGIQRETVVLVTADHGGKGKKHGGSTMEEIEIPWIVSGPGIAAGKEIKAPVNTWDTAATLARILGLQPPDCWIAKPVAAAFR